MWQVRQWELGEFNGLLSPSLLAACDLPAQNGSRGIKNEMNTA